MIFKNHTTAHLLAVFLVLHSVSVLAFAPNLHRCDHHHQSSSSTSYSRYHTSSKAVESDSIVEDEESSSSLSSSATYFSPNRPLEKTRFGDEIDETDLEASIESSANEYSFFDEATIYVRAGSGGQGASTYKKGAGGQDGPPDGGSGGKGGNVVMILDESLNTLAGLTNAWRPNSFGGSGAASQVRDQRISFRAETGADGGRQIKNGRYGKDVTIRVPPGTVVQEVIEREDGTEELIDIGSIVFDEPSLVVAIGGEGGEGSGINSKGRGVRRPRLAPQGGQRKTIRLTLKIVADVALVGVPNAGKSTFLAAVTRAKPKIANYPFTTVIPNLGVWVPSQVYDDNDRGGDIIDGAGSEGLVLCDVPGLIAGAAQGVGLGHAFLRHVERCHMILHLVDATSDDPIADFEMLNRELVNYGTGQLARMPQVVVVNKLDAMEGRGGEDWEAGLQTKLSREELTEKLTKAMSHSRLMWMSAKERDGVDDLMVRMAAFVKKVKETASEASSPVD